MTAAPGGPYHSYLLPMQPACWMWNAYVALLAHLWPPPARRLDPEGPTDRKKIALGTKPIALRTFRSGAAFILLGYLCRASVGLVGSCSPLNRAPRSRAPNSAPGSNRRASSSSPPAPLPAAPPARSRGAAAVFAASDRPTIIYSSNRKLLYSNLNENEASRAELKRAAVWFMRKHGSGRVLPEIID